MKKLIVILSLVVLSTTGFSQSFKGFFGPVEKDMFSASDRSVTSVWLFRPVVTLTALQFTLTNPVEVASLNSLGTGISYQHFIERNEEPYNNLGFNALILFNQDPLGIAPANLSFAVTGNFLQYVSAGVGYSLAIKKFFLLTGVTYNFN